jgi:hypothetical protein
MTNDQQMFNNTFSGDVCYKKTVRTQLYLTKRHTKINSNAIFSYLRVWQVF